MSHFKPSEQKRLEGNPGKRALAQVVDIQPQIALNEAVERPLEEALHESLEHAVWIGVTDGLMVSMLSTQVAERAEIARQVAEGALSPHELRKIDDQLLKVMASLGLDPVSRSKLGLSEVKAASKLDQMRARRAGGDVQD